MQKAATNGESRCHNSKVEVNLNFPAVVDIGQSPNPATSTAVRARPTVENEISIGQVEATR
jgi:hypothetical protein